MPIPQLKPNRNKQSWRHNKKKYYVKRQSLKTSGRPKKRRAAINKIKLSDKFLSSDIKRKAIIALALVAALGVLSFLVFFAWIARGVADVSKLIDRVQPQSTKIFDRSGEELLYEFHGAEKRTEVALHEIPDYVKWATVSIEDKNYYKHGGISLWGIFRGVVVRTLTGKPPQGGSTLTQQFVKNAILSNERTVIRKMKEWVLAYRIEKTYNKDEILGLYFNEIPYGSTAYGVEAASQLYFGKSVRDISLAEAAVLAALPQAPSKYSPYGPNRELLIGRQQYILNLMAEQQYISKEQAETAKEAKIEFISPNINIKAPHFVMYIKEILSEKYGEKTVEQGGLKVITTLDLYKQEIAEEVVSAQAEANEAKYEASNAALISLDPKTGQILAMVGSKDYFNDDIDGQVNITTSKRQPGSSLKPLIYAASFLKGYTPNTVLYDVVTNFSNNQSEPYEPHNYDLKEHGPVTIRKALAGSLNIPAVKAIYLAGIDNVLDLAGEFGYTTLTERERYGLSLVLGGGEVKLIEHTNAYGAFAREGLAHPVASILRVEDKDGKVLEEFKATEAKVLDPKVARMINNILSDNAARAYAFGERNWLTLGGRPVAAKTGTTNDYRDAWTIGYTPSIVTGVWVGNNDNSKMKGGAAGGVVAAPIWHDYMDKILGDTPVEYFKDPEIPQTGKPILDGEAGQPIIIKIDKASGLLATEYTPASMIVEKTYYEPHCILYYIDRNDPLGDAPKKPEKDPQFELWESRVTLWAEKQAASSSSPIESEPPTEYDNLHRPENIPTLSLVTPGNNYTVLNSLLKVQIQTSAPRGVNRAEYYIDNNLILSNSNYPFNMAKDLSFLPNGFHNLKIRVCDDVDNCQSRELEINLALESSPINPDASLAWSGISSGLALSNIDFPLELNVQNDNPGAIARVDFYYQADNTDELVLIGSAQPIDTNTVSVFWTTPPPSGSYKISALGKTWVGDNIDLSPLLLIINNITEEN